MSDTQGNTTQADVVKNNMVTERDQDAKVDPDAELSKREEIARKYAERQHGYVDDGDGGNADDDGAAGDGDHVIGDQPSEPEIVVVKINGREREVEKKKVDDAGGIEVYQKLVAADEKLQRAAQDRKVLEGEAERIRRKEAELAEKERDLLSRSQSRDGGGDAVNLAGKQKAMDLAKSYRELLYEGQNDEADEVLIQLTAMMHENRATEAELVNEIGQKAADTVIQRMRANEERQAVQSAQQKHEDIFSDPFLTGIADAHSVDIESEHPDWQPSQIVEEAITRTREWLKGRSPAPAAPPPTSQPDGMNGRLDDKRQISPIRAAGGRAKPADKGPKVETNAEYISRLRKERGLE